MSKFEKSEPSIDEARVEDVSSQIVEELRDLVDMSIRKSDSEHEAYMSRKKDELFNHIMGLLKGVPEGYRLAAIRELRKQGLDYETLFIPMIVNSIIDKINSLALPYDQRKALELFKALKEFDVVFSYDDTDPVEEDYIRSVLESFDVSIVEEKMGDKNFCHVVCNNGKTVGEAFGDIEKFLDANGEKNEYMHGELSENEMNQYVFLETFLLGDIRMHQDNPK